MIGFIIYLVMCLILMGICYKKLIADDHKFDGFLVGFMMGCCLIPILNLLIVYILFMK